MAERWVVLGVAGARSRWLGRIARWATSATLPVELVTTLDVAEALAVLAAGRPVSALVLDADGGAVERELVARASAAGAATIAVTSARTLADLDDVGCDLVLADDFGPEALLEALRRVARPVRAGEALDGVAPAAARLAADGPARPLVALTGHGGAGASTAAMALAQGLAAQEDLVVALVDGCRRADLAMYHDQADPVPGLPEVVELHRRDRPDPDAVRAMLRPVPDRGYRLLTGLRRPGDWGAHRRRSVAAALDGLRRAHDVVVVDVDPDLEDESSTASVDVEDRHAVALTVATSADLVLVVGRPGVHGLHALVRHLDDWHAAGVPAERLVPVVATAPASPAARAALNRTLHGLTVARDGGPLTTAPPLHLRATPGLESTHRVVGPLPGRLADPLARAVAGLLTRVGPRPTGPPQHAVVVPGSLHPSSGRRDRVA